jgi:hypothetical protein
MTRHSSPSTAKTRSGERPVREVLGFFEQADGRARSAARKTADAIRGRRNRTEKQAPREIERPRAERLARSCSGIDSILLDCDADGRILKSSAAGVALEGRLLEDEKSIQRRGP